MRKRWGQMSRLGRAVLTFTAAGTASLVLLLAAFLFLPAIGAPSDEALAYSLTQEAGGSVLLGVSGCQERPAGVQICNVSDTSNSGSGRYRVRMDGGRCYHARKTSPDSWEEGGPHLKREVNGCVRWRDQVRIMDRI